MTLTRRIFANGYQSLLGFIAGFFSLLAPAIPIIVTSFAFIFADTYYGYKVSRKFGKKHFESNKLWKMAQKLRDVLIVICLGLLVDKYILLTYEDLSTVKVVAGTICTAEGLSLLESFRALHPHALLSKILSKIIKSKAEKYLDIDLSDIVDLNNSNDSSKNTKTTC